MKKKIVDREPRQCTYLIVRVSKTGLRKIFSADAQLIDLSSKGMKLKFANPFKAAVGDNVIVKLSNPAKIDQFYSFEVEIRWTSPQDNFIGVSVLSIGDIEAQLISHYMDVSRKMGRKVV